MKTLMGVRGWFLRLALNAICQFRVLTFAALFSLGIIPVPSLLAQGTIRFSNSSADLSSPPDRLVRFCDRSMGPFGTNNSPVVNFGSSSWRAQLYYGSSTATENQLIPLTAAPAQFRASTSTLFEPGSWAGGLRTFVGFDTGSTLNLQVRIWDSQYGPTFEQAVPSGGGGLYGMSPIFSYTIPTDPSAGPEQFVMKNFRVFYVGWLCGSYCAGAPTKCNPNGTAGGQGPCALADQTVNVGQDVSFTIAPYACGLLTYFWQFNGNTIWTDTTSPTEFYAGGLDSPGWWPKTLTITNAQLSNAGIYSVIVANAYGAITTAPATLTVIGPTVVEPRLAARPLDSSQVQVAWRTNLSAYNLESALYLGATWLQVTDGIVIQGNQFIYTEPAASLQKFFRLRKQ